MLMAAPGKTVLPWIVATLLLRGSGKQVFSPLSSLPQYALASASTWAQPPAWVSNVGSQHALVYSSIKVCHHQLHHLSLLQDDWSAVGVTVSCGLSPEFATYFSPNLANDPVALTV
jgi:hypothetical protein